MGNYGARLSGDELVLDKRYATIRKVEIIDLEERPEVAPDIGEASVVRRYSDVARFASPAIVKLVNASENDGLFNF